MIIDFAISNTGDLLFQEQDINSSSLKVSFAFSKTKATKIIFDLSEFEVNVPSSNALNVKFELVKRTANKSVAILKQDDVARQLLILRLKSTLGELPLRPNFGSKISLLKHKEINRNNLSKLEHVIKEAIQDIINNPVVEASPYIDFNNGYKQTVMINIYSNEKKILNYIVER